MPHTAILPVMQVAQWLIGKNARYYQVNSGSH